MKIKLPKKKNDAMLSKISLAVLSIVLCSSSLFANDIKPQAAILSLSASNKTVFEVLQIIEKKSDYLFVYDKNEIDVNRKVNVNVNDGSINDVLLLIFKNTDVKYQKVGTNIVLTKIEKPLPNNENSKQSQLELQTVEGKVVDAHRQALPGVTVVVKGTTNGAITDIDGNYAITKVPLDAILQFSFIGMKAQELAVAGREHINVKMTEDAVGLDEVVAIGYGTIKAGDITSSVASVSSENFTKGAVKDVGQLVQGKVAGLVITNSSGDPTATTQIQLRGTNTFGGANTSPLVLIDGIPGSLTTVPPEDVESIEVLKDGSAAAIYGTRGTNGVIIITTKQYKDGGNINKVEYAAYASTSQIAKRPSMLNADEFRSMYPDELDNGANTDWLDEIMRTPVSHVHNVTLRGGNSQTNYIANVNYNSSQGIMLRSANETLKGRIQVNHNMFDGMLKLKVGMISMTNQHPSSSNNGSFNGYTYRMAVSRKPTDPVYNEDGSWNENFSKFEYENPVARIRESYGDVKNTEVRYNSNVIFNPLKGLTLSAVLAYSRFHRNHGYSETLNHISSKKNGLDGWSEVGAATTLEKVAELTALYETSIGEHKFSLLGGYSYNERDYENMYIHNYGFQDDYFGGWHNIGIGSALKEGLAGAGSSKTISNLIGTFGRATYSYKNRYLVMGSLRYEGASQLWGTDNEWGLFPSVSFGWRITEEYFMQNQSLFDNLKLRIGYGVTGSQPNDGFLGVAMLAYGNFAYVNGEWMQTIVPASNANPNLRWEEKKETNLGLDFSMLNNRLSGSVDVYNRKVDGLLYDFVVSVPPYDYGTIKANGGVMINRGVELMLSGTPILKNDFEWNTTVLFSNNKNKLENIDGNVFKTDYDYFYTGWVAEPVTTQSHIVEVGERIGNFWGHKVIDVDEDGKWIYEGRDGEPVAYDDYQRSPEDKKVIGNGVPTTYVGWNNTFRYKNFDLNITMRGAFDYQIFNEARMYYENTKNSRAENRLTSVNDLIFGKKTLSKDVEPEFNSYYVEDGDYWKIDNITLGYTFKNTGKVVKSLRVYGSILNTLTITGYKGVDPEVNTSGLSPGFDSRNQYPTIRMFTMGLSASF